MFSTVQCFKLCLTCFQPNSAANIMPNPVSNTASVKTDTIPQSVQQENKSLPVQGMMGNMTFAQQQGMLNSYLLQGLVPGISDMHNANLGLLPGVVPGLAPNVTPGLLPQFNPFLIHQLQSQLETTTGFGPLTAHMSQLSLQLGTMPTFVGRGQMLNPSSVGLLPGLLPLVQKLSLAGRGSGRGSTNQ